MCNSIGVNLRMLRKARGLTQDQLAFQLGVHQTHVGAIERNAKTPSLDLAVKIATYFDVPLHTMVLEPLETEPC